MASPAAIVAIPAPCLAVLAAWDRTASALAVAVRPQPDPRGPHPLALEPVKTGPLENGRLVYEQVMLLAACN